MSIPKIIHYCWFGKNPMPKLAVKCMKSWNKFCPDFEIKRWDETNFDINAFSNGKSTNLPLENKRGSNDPVPYIKEAYDSKKWAFVSDFVRLYPLYNFGGIYMDTDVEVIKPLYKFLEHKAFSGFESIDYIPTGIMGAEKENVWIKDLLNYYTNKHFVKSDGSFDTTTNTMIITDITTKKYGLIKNNQFQMLKNEIAIYPNNVFCPMSWQTRELNITDNTHTIHHFDGSWKEKNTREKIKRFLGPNITKKIVSIKNFIRMCEGIIIPPKKQILFIAYEGKQYNCNPKYITEYLLSNYPNKFNILWAFNEPERFEYLKEKGIKVISTKTKEFYSAMTNSKIIVSNAGLNVALLNKKQFYIETNHGTAYEKVGAEEPHSSFQHKENVIKTFKRVNLILSGNTKLSEQVFKGKACQSKAEILEQGTPRNDIFFTDYSNITKKIHEYYNIPTKTKILLYAPTCRTDRKVYNYELDYQKLKEILSKKFNGNWVVLFRKHYNCNEYIDKINTIDASNYPDMQELLCASDVLITDYSSCMWDFSLTGKPCFIYATDIEKYKQEREFYTPMEQWPFPIANNNNELSENIEVFDKQSYDEKIKQHHQDLGLCETGKASKAVCERIYKEYFK